MSEKEVETCDHLVFIVNEAIKTWHHFWSLFAASRAKALWYLVSSRSFGGSGEERSPRTFEETKRDLKKIVHFMTCIFNLADILRL